MKKTMLFLSGLLFIIVSCQKNRAQFSDPQPKDVKDLSSFPKKIIGSYYDYQNEVALDVLESLVIQQFNRMDTISGSDFLKIAAADRNEFQKINDSMYTFRSVITDTLFNIDKGDVLRKFKGFYFLNTKTKEGFWNVSQLTVKKQLLRIDELFSEEGIQKLEEITETTVTDTLQPVIFNPTKKQFREFVRSNGFTEGPTYLKK